MAPPFERAAELRPAIYGNTDSSIH